MRGSRNIQDVGRVLAVNDGPLNVYKKLEKCNVINGTDMMFFPPFQHRDDILWGFAPAVCKSFALRFKHRKTVRGVKTSYKYLDFFDPLVMFGLKILSLDSFKSFLPSYFYLAGPCMRMQSIYWLCCTGVNRFVPMFENICFDQFSTLLFG